MNSLKAVFGAMQSRDHEKVAQVRASQGLPRERDLSQVDPGLLKQAQDYDHIGRVLAHNVFADMVKTAVEEALPGASEADKKSAFEEAMESAMSGKKKEKKEGTDEEDDAEYEEKTEPREEKKEEGEEKTSAAKVKVMKAKKKKILAKMAADPKYMSALVNKYLAR
ncbi:MAG: hypothetical protein KBF21_19155 [Thermoanaerobaculia bacterium]|nr:hypothetical protein [Thermoanaerobaculia bacterium]